MGTSVSPCRQGPEVNAHMLEFNIAARTADADLEGRGLHSSTFSAQPEPFLT